MRWAKPRPGSPPRWTRCYPDAGPETRFVGLYGNANEHIYPRDHAELTSWFAGTELVEPGVTRLCDWRQVDPDWPPAGPSEAEDPAAPLGYGGVGRVN